MLKVKLSVVALLLILLNGAVPLTASAPLSASAAALSDTINVQSVDVEMVFDGVKLKTPTGQYVFIYKNTTYVPIRFVSYALQKNVSWDARNLKVTVSEPSSSEMVVIKEYLLNARSTKDQKSATKSIMLSKINASYVFGDSIMVVPSVQSSYMLNGSLYVPLRFLSESVGNKITWEQKTKTITATSAGFREQDDGAIESNEVIGANSPSATATAAPVNGATAGGVGTGTLTYDQITSAVEAKLNALRSQSTSTLMSIALEYLSATDDVTKASILAKGKQTLASFTSSFNSIVADAEQQLSANGYSTDIINQYRATFEAELQKGLEIAGGMGG